MKFFSGIILGLLLTLIVLQALLLNPWWHGAIFNFLGQTPELKSERSYLLNHFRFGAPLSNLNFSANELSHIADIDRLLAQEQAVAWLLISALAIVIFILAKKKSPTEFSQGIAKGLLTVGSGLMIIVLVICLQFETIFRTAHELIFPGGNWQFDPASDIIIQLYPPQFFQIFFPAIIIIILIVQLIVYFALRLLPRR